MKRLKENINLLTVHQQTPRQQYKARENRKKQIARGAITEAPKLYENKDEGFKVFQEKVGDKYRLVFKIEGYGTIIITLQATKYNNKKAYIQDLDRGKKHLKTEALRTLAAFLQEEILENCTKKRFCHAARLIHTLSKPKEKLEGKHVHHLDGDTINNKEENLMVLTEGSHIEIHLAEKELGFLPWIIEGSSELSKERAVYNGYTLIYFSVRGRIEKLTPKFKPKKNNILFRRGHKMERFTKDNIIAILEEYELLKHFQLVEKQSKQAVGKDTLILSTNYTSKLCLELALEASQSVRNTITRRLKEAMNEKGYISKRGNIWESKNKLAEIKEYQMKFWERAEKSKGFPNSEKPRFTGIPDNENISP